MNVDKIILIKLNLFVLTFVLILINIRDLIEWLNFIIFTISI